MKNLFRLVIVLCIIYSCQKNEKSGELPIVTTKQIEEITDNSVICGGIVTDDGGLPITKRGVCYATNINPAITDSKTSDGTGIGDFDSQISIPQNTTYYLRAYATNDFGTAYGEERSVIIYLNESSQDITDIDGNIYKTVKIGSQTWMSENLKTTKYNNGTALIYTNNTSDQQGGYCYYYDYPEYTDTEGYRQTYGALYNWYAVETEKLCPVGWHVPTKSEWEELIRFLGGEDIAGEKLKQGGNSGFNGLMGGYRRTGTTPFGGLYSIGSFWTSSISSSGKSYSYILQGNSIESRDDYHACCFNVRCIRNQ